MSTEPPGPPLLLFDGDCAFCSSSVRGARRVIRRMPTAMPYQTTELAPLGLSAEECADAVRYVRDDGTTLAAHDAVSALLRDSGRGWWLLGTLLRLPGVHWFSGVVYRWVARNRARLPGGTPACGLDDRR